jgi:DNA processing protein
MEEAVCRIGLTLIEGVGDVNAKALLAYCGSAREVFLQKKAHLLKIPGIGPATTSSILKSKSVLKRAEEELVFIEKYQITPLFFTDENYPLRLKQCDDGPLMLYYKGTANLNAEKVIAIVGTRSPSEYGKEKTAELVSDLQATGALIVSGLAYGVDTLAHKSALEVGLETVGVLGHGLDRIYPMANNRLAKRMLGHGGLLTDFRSGTLPEAVNFPKRNRIVAGLCDALIMIESRRTGGSLITATIANSYNRDVFALPGRAGEPMAEGGNGLIKRNGAALVETAEDLLLAMRWQADEKPRKSVAQLKLAVNLTHEERLVLSLLSGNEVLHIDEICVAAQMPVSKVAAILLQLEFYQLVRSKPGKMYSV